MQKNALIIVVGVLVFYQSLGAQTWEATKRLTYNSGYSLDPSIAIDASSNIHVVWHDSTPGNAEIYYQMSTDMGANWTTKRLTWNSGDSYFPDIAVDSSDNIHVVWTDETPGNAEIYYKTSTDVGANWTTKRLTWNSGISYSPDIAVDSSDNIHVVWNDYTPGNFEIYYKTSTDMGANWTKKRLTWNSGSSYSPDIAVDSSDNIHVVWNDKTPGNFEIYYKTSTDVGANWTTKRLSYNSGLSQSPAIAVDSSDNIHVVWNDYTPGNLEIYYKTSTDVGANWTTKRLTWNSGDSYFPDIAVDSSDNIHVVWNDYTPGNAEIYYQMSTDVGANWTTKRLTWNSGDSRGQAIAIDATDNIHIVWKDDSPGNDEIYYKKGIQ